MIRHGLLGDVFHSGSKEHLAKVYIDADSGGMILRPTVQGAETFLWAQGISGATGHELMDGSLTFDKPEINIINGAVAING